MQSHPANTVRSGANRNDREIDSMLRGITSTELQFLGMTQVTYAKPVLLASGNVGYAIHAADGTELAVVDDLATAAELVGARDLTLLPVH